VLSEILIPLSAIACTWIIAATVERIFSHQPGDLDDQLISNDVLQLLKDVAEIKSKLDAMTLKDGLKLKK